MIDVAREVADAEARIRPHIRETPLEPSPYFGAAGSAEVVLKCENLQHTGSFKVRGALSKVLSLSEEERARGVVTASTGNHGAAVSFALGKVGGTGVVFVPETAAATKLAAIERLGGEIRRHGTDSGETELFARRYAEETGATYVPPYNDARVIGGQGTIGAELARQADRLDAVYVSVGGGGLIAGIGGYLKGLSPDTQVIGCSPAASQVMVQSVAAGKILDLPSEPTLSDGTAGGVEPDAITLPLVQRYVDRFVTVSEAEIRAALRQFMDAHHMMIEGAAAVAIAAYLKDAAAWRGKTVAIVLCGANISLEVLRDVLQD